MTLPGLVSFGFRTVNFEVADIEAVELVAKIGHVVHDAEPRSATAVITTNFGRLRKGLESGASYWGETKKYSITLLINPLLMLTLETYK